MDEGVEKSWFWRELEEGQIHFRDRLQFELKSEFSTQGGKEESSFLQEIYLFIPESLQINRQTYSREKFYLDEINLIRFKTPSLTFRELLDPENGASPLVKIRQLSQQGSDIVHELKMFGNIFRSSVREEVKDIVELLLDDEKENSDLIRKKITALIHHIREVRQNFNKLREDVKVLHGDSLIWVDEFLRLVVENYMTALLDQFRRKMPPKSSTLDKELAELIVEEGLAEETGGNMAKEEEILLRSSHLNKYLYEALALKNVRVEIKKKHGAWIGMSAAGIAMLVYMILFVRNANTFGINSVPFVLLAVFFYIVKDRIKEGLKDLYQQHAYRLFPDYSTNIETRQGKRIGILNESFQFIDQAPDDITRFRQGKFQREPEEFRMVETIMQYKKELIFTTHTPLELNTIFRFNIHQFVEKAGDPLQTRLKLNPETLQIVEKKLPKIYYLTVILKNTFGKESETKKFRVILNKLGIERVQYLGALRET